MEKIHLQRGGQSQENYRGPSLVVKTLCFHCRGMNSEFGIWSGHEDPSCRTAQPKHREQNQQAQKTTERQRECLG